MIRKQWLFGWKITIYTITGLWVINEMHPLMKRKFIPTCAIPNLTTSFKILPI